jgi:hypothetical protein
MLQRDAEVITSFALKGSGSYAFELPLRPFVEAAKELAVRAVKSPSARVCCRPLMGGTHRHAHRRTRKRK